ncbi:unnamed protein product [Heligmosomoides polygyrus]|uniref:Uncharacterized protein n=1 Tax=Heligmosomoides polygyrus TaxID=6339 RepID=A0A183FLM6_HELPZ|nr:unnamed protein product [Heligmosomoides polygyrus]
MAGLMIRDPALREGRPRDGKGYLFRTTFTRPEVRESEKDIMDLAARTVKDAVGKKGSASEFGCNYGKKDGEHVVLYSNQQSKRLSEFIVSIKTNHRNSRFQKPPSQRWTRESPGGQFHNEIDHIIFNRRYCLTDVSVVLKFYTGTGMGRHGSEGRRPATTPSLLR